MGRMTRKYSRDADEVFAKVRTACQTLGLRVTNEDAITRSLQVSTGMSALSWGETLKIVVSQHQDGSTVVVDSGPKVWFNLTAEGRAERTAANLLSQLDRVV